MDGWMGGRKEGWMGGRKEGWMDGWGEGCEMDEMKGEMEGKKKSELTI